MSDCIIRGNPALPLVMSRYAPVQCVAVGLWRKLAPGGVGEVLTGDPLDDRGDEYLVFSRDEMDGVPVP
jgi:hypothetical protein